MLEDLDDIIERCAVAAADRVPEDQAYPEVYNDINWLDEEARNHPGRKVTPGNNGDRRSTSKVRVPTPRKGSPDNDNSTRSSSTPSTSSRGPSTRDNVPPRKASESRDRGRANMPENEMLPNSNYMMLFDICDEEEHRENKKHIYVCSPYHIYCSVF